MRIRQDAKRPADLIVSDTRLLFKQRNPRILFVFNNLQHDLVQAFNYVRFLLSQRCLVRNLEDVARSANEITNGALDELLAHVKTQGANARGDGVPVVVFNSLYWPRAEVIEAQVQLSGPAREVQVLDGAGLRVEHQLLAPRECGRRAGSGHGARSVEIQRAGPRLRIACRRIQRRVRNRNFGVPISRNRGS